MRSLLFVAYAAAACGRLDFDILRDGGNDTANGSDAGSASTVMSNIVFATSGTFTGALGGLAGADASCAQAAQQAGLAGAFVAWISTTSVNAIDRLAGARGWVRTDGVPVMDTIASGLVGQMFAPIDHDEHGLVVTYGGNIPFAWTGTEVTGDLASSPAACGDWTVSDAGSDGMTGALSMSGPFFSAQVVGGNGGTCDTSNHLLCFQIDHDEPVSPPPAVTTGVRVVFVSSQVGAVGLSGFDARCASDAAAAGLAGSYLAAVATSTATIASRFTPDARSVVRIDGIEVAPGLTELFDSGQLESFIDQQADGTYLEPNMAPFVRYVWTGAPLPTSLGTDSCSSWTTTQSSGGSRVGDPTSALTIELWGNAFSVGVPNAYTEVSCDSAITSVLCIEE